MVAEVLPYRSGDNIIIGGKSFDPINAKIIAQEILIAVGSVLTSSTDNNKFPMTIEYNITSTVKFR